MFNVVDGFNSVVANAPPTANAGTNQTGIAANTLVNLDGSGSTDSDGTITGYAWTQTGGAVSVTINNANTATPTFTTPSSAQTTILSLVVTDNEGSTSEPSTVSIANLEVETEKMSRYVIAGNTGDAIPQTLKAGGTASFLIIDGYLKTALANSTGTFYEDSGVSDGTVEIRISLAGTGGASSGTAVRQVQSNDYYTYVSAMINRSGSLRLFTFSAGSATQIGSTYTIPNFSPDTFYDIRHEFNGSSHVVYLSGVQRVTGVSELNLTSQKHGGRVSDGSVKVSAIGVLNINDEPTTPDNSAFGQLIINSDDNLPTNESRVCTMLQLPSFSRKDKAVLYFSEGNAIFDSYLLRQGTNVTVYAPNSKGTDASLAYANQAQLTARPNNLTKLRTILSLGPSTACGAESGEVIDDTPVNGALLFNNIPAESAGNKRISSGDMDSLVTFSDAREFKEWFGTKRQCHGFGYTSKITNLRHSAGDYEPYLWVNNAFDGETISGMSNIESVYWLNQLDLMTHAKYRAAELVLELEFTACGYVTGETGSSYSSFQTALRGYHDQIITKAAELNGQTGIPMIITSSAPQSVNREEDNSFVYRYVQENDDVYYASCPYYAQYHYPSDDGLHRLANGYTICGEYEAIILDKYLTAKALGTENPIIKVLEPLSFTTSGNTIIVTMNVPVGPMVIDTTSLPPLAGLGILYRKIGGTEIVPTVTIDGNDLRINIGSNTPTAGDFVIFGSGDTPTWPQMTNIRDSQNIPSSVAGTTLYNWLLCLSHTLTVEEV